MYIKCVLSETGLSYQYLKMGSAYSLDVVGGHSLWVWKVKPKWRIKVVGLIQINTIGIDNPGIGNRSIVVW